MDFGPWTSMAAGFSMGFMPRSPLSVAVQDQVSKVLVDRLAKLINLMPGGESTQAQWVPTVGNAGLFN